MRGENGELASAMRLEAELGVRHGTIAGLAKSKLITPVWIPGRKRPKYDRKDVYRALGVDRD